MSGFITLHRKLLDWEWYKDINTKTLFIHCLLKANWEDKNWRGNVIKRGDFITSVSVLSKETKLTIKQVRLSLDRLEKTNEVVRKTTNKNTSITLVKYNEYQNEEKQKTNKRQTKDKQKTNKGQQLTSITSKQLEQVTNENICYREFLHLKLLKSDFDKLELEYLKLQIDDVLDRIENYKENKKYTSLYLTAKAWLKKEPKKNNKNSEMVY